MRWRAGVKVVARAVVRAAVRAAITAAGNAAGRAAGRAVVRAAGRAAGMAVARAGRAAGWVTHHWAVRGVGRSVEHYRPAVNRAALVDYEDLKEDEKKKKKRAGTSGYKHQSDQSSTGSA